MSCPNSYQAFAMGFHCNDKCSDESLGSTKKPAILSEHQANFEMDLWNPWKRCHVVLHPSQDINECHSVPPKYISHRPFDGSLSRHLASCSSIVGCFANFGPPCNGFIAGSLSKASNQAFGLSYELLRSRFAFAFYQTVRGWQTKSLHRNSPGRRAWM